MTSAIDWTAIGQWAGGITVVLVSVVIAAVRAVGAVSKVVKEQPATTTERVDTKIITTDSVAMHELAGSLEALNVTAKELHALLKAEIEERVLDEEADERAERKFKQWVAQHGEGVPSRRRPARKTE